MGPGADQRSTPFRGDPARRCGAARVAPRGPRTIAVERGCTRGRRRARAFAQDELGRDEGDALDHQVDDRTRSLSRRRDQPDAGVASRERPLGPRERLDPEYLALLRAELIVGENTVAVELRELHQIVE